MSQANELTNQIINFIFKQGGYAWRASSTGIFDAKLGGYRTAAKKGVSDVLACFSGKCIAIEVKIGKDRLSSEQDGFLTNIKATGGLAFVAKDLKSFEIFWNEFVGK